MSIRDSVPVHLPNTLPGGMTAHVHTVPVPTVDDRVILGPITMPMREFCAMVEHVLTVTPLKADDPRARLLDRLQNNTVRTGLAGDRLAILEQPAVVVH